MEINRLIEIAKDLGLASETAQLQLIKERSLNENCELILPLVGEFDAGKTSLINALLDSERKLEIGFEPTTATLFEIHFGADRNHAQIIQEDGTVQEIEDFSSIKNSDIKDSLVVNVFDTSTKVPSNIILVDTPGLSSPVAQHRQVLVDFLPNADGVLLVVDINAQLTRSLTEFISSMVLAKRPVFMVLTKCDTKSKQDVQATAAKLSRESGLPLQQIVSVSASTENTQEMQALLASIHKEKQSILAQVNAQRIRNVTRAIIGHIDEMLKASNSDKDLEQAIREKELELQKIHNKIDQLIGQSQLDIEDEKVRISRQFEDSVFTRLDAIVGSKSQNYDAEATAAVNGLACINLNEFKQGVSRIVMDNCMRNNNTGIDFQCIQGMDLSQLNLEGLTYNLDLNAIGHEYDKHIAVGVKVAAAVAVVAAAVAAAPAAAAGPTAGSLGTAGGASGTAVTAGTAGAAGTGVSVGEAVLGTASVIDTASDIGSILSNAKTASRVQKAMQYAQQAGEQYENIEQLNKAAGQKTGQDKGFVEGMVSIVTESTWGKPQRRRAIHEYIDGTLMPQFKDAMNMNCTRVINIIRETLLSAAQVSIAEKKIALEQLVEQFNTQKKAFDQRKEILRDYKNELLTQ